MKKSLADRRTSVYSAPSVLVPAGRLLDAHDAQQATRAEGTVGGARRGSEPTVLVLRSCWSAVRSCARFVCLCACDLRVNFSCECDPHSGVVPIFASRSATCPRPPCPRSLAERSWQRSSPPPCQRIAFASRRAARVSLGRRLALTSSWARVWWWRTGSSSTKTRQLAR